MAKKKVAQDEWEGAQLTTESKTKLEDDKGTGQAVVLRFFDFGANIETFKQHKPTGQELFNSHLKGIETLLWRDGLVPFNAVEPRLMFSKDKTRYRFVVACTLNKGISVGKGNYELGAPQTLSQIANETRTNSG